MDPNATTPSPERQAPAIEAGGEKLTEQNLEAKVAPAAAEASQNGPKADDGAAVAQAQVTAVTAAAADDQTQATTSTTDPAAAAPLVAADVDVIEPEWVKKAEEAVAQNRDDPRAEENAVEAVQIEYLKKRYNLDVKSGDEAT